MSMWCIAHGTAGRQEPSWRPTRAEGIGPIRDLCGPHPVDGAVLKVDDAQAHRWASLPTDDTIARAQQDPDHGA